MKIISRFHIFLLHLAFLSPASPSLGLPLLSFYLCPAAFSSSHSSLSADTGPKSQYWDKVLNTAKRQKDFYPGEQETFVPFRTLDGPLWAAFTLFKPVSGGEEFRFQIILVSKEVLYYSL